MISTKVLVIAVSTFREAVRDKILYSLLFFSVAMIAGSVLVAELTLGEYEKTIRDVGLASISIFGLAIAIFAGIGLVWKEIERRTIYTIASKPVGRGEFLLGKYLGLLLTLAVEVAVMGVVLHVTVLVTGTLSAWALWPAILLAFAEMAVVTAFALLFGAFTSPSLAAMFTIGLTLVGKSTAQLLAVVELRGSDGLVRFARALYRVVPDLGTFDIRTEAAYGLPVDAALVAYACGYAAIWSVLVLVVASLIFERRDFK